MQAIGAGTTTVTLHANGMSASVSVTVTISGRQVDISPGSLTFDALGDTKSVRVRVLDEHGDEDPDATFSAFSTFSGNLPKGIVISWVDDVHLEVTAEGPGSGQITISSDGAAFAILPVTVFQEPASLEVSPASATLAVGGTTTVRATVKDANGNPIHVNEGDGRGGLHVYWTTSDSSVATVEPTRACAGAAPPRRSQGSGQAQPRLRVGGVATLSGRPR